MGEGAPAGLTAAWKLIDGSLRGVSQGMKKVVRLLRALRIFLVFGILAILTSAVFQFVWKAAFPYAYAVSVLFLVIPLVILFVLVALPLRAKSIVRLVDMGYPANAKELFVRIVARKLHEQSIETEEMLVEVAWNESRKALRKYRQRADKLRRRLDEMDEDADPDGTA